MEVGLTENEFAKIAGQISRRVKLNDSLAGKINKVATPEQVAKLLILQRKHGEPLPFCPAVGILRKIKC